MSPRDDGSVTSCGTASSSMRMTVPLYVGRSEQKEWAPPPNSCVFWVSRLHKSKDGCERCLHSATSQQRKEFERNHHHHRVMMTRGGCSRNCPLFPRQPGENPVRICQRCFYDTHELKKW
eukprot:scaffold32766_cov58-Attheya_sp.AAC.1